MNTESVTVDPVIVTPDVWLEQRRTLLRREKELTRQRDKLSEERRRLPWVKVEKNYRFQTEAGEVGLAELFGDRTQLIVYHFMFGPDWAEGCKSCSFLMDHVDGPWRHLKHRDVNFAAVSRAPLAMISAFQRRMGWEFRWVSSYGSDFNYDFHVSLTPEQMERGGAEYNFDRLPAGIPFDELPGMSVFVRDANRTVYHTYSTYARGLDHLIGAFSFLDLTPKGRDESGIMDWIRHHDRYESVS